MNLMRFLPPRWWSWKAWRTWGSYIHWRLETYGVFYPKGKINWKALKSLLKQLPSYRHWLTEIDSARTKPPVTH